MGPCARPGILSIANPSFPAPYTQISTRRRKRCISCHWNYLRQFLCITSIWAWVCLLRRFLNLAWPDRGVAVSEPSTSVYVILVQSSWAAALADRNKSQLREIKLLSRVSHHQPVMAKRKSASSGQPQGPPKQAAGGGTRSSNPQGANRPANTGHCDYNNSSIIFRYTTNVLSAQKTGNASSKPPTSSG